MKLTLAALTLTYATVHAEGEPFPPVHCDGDPNICADKGTATICSRMTIVTLPEQPADTADPVVPTWGGF